MASSFFSEFGLMWYLKELKKDEFRKFKELLKQEPLHLGLQQIPWSDVKKATREDLANLLVKHYEKQQAWDVTFIIFQKINRKDLCEKAKREIAGHGKMYRAHVKEKFSEMWFRDSVTRIYDCFEKELIKKEHEYLEFLFAPKETRRQTVILRGIQGIGKTTLLVRLMLAWAEGTLYQQFSYIFYFCCRELKRLTAASLAELVCRDWSNSLTPIGEITSEPERLLFIIDGFEELKYGLNEPESDLCSNWMEQRPIQVILSSLLRKKMLPECSLLIAAVPTYPQVIEDRLECPEIKTLSGFTEGERKVYFSHIFQDKSRSIKAFRFIRENVQLFSMCQIPILCWVVCTCLKQEMERKKDLALTCRRTTSLYSSFVLNLFTPMGSSCLDEQSQGLLKGLCSLAAEGMWNDTFVFNEEDLRRNGLVDSDIPALLGVKVLHKCRYTENSYMFIHVCIQEFCAALFYLVKSHTNHPNPAVGSTKALLSTYLKNKKVHWIFLGCFMFGLLNEKEQQKLDAFFGYHLCQEEIQQTFQQHLWSVSESGHLQGQVDFLALCYCLFEMENEDFIKWAMNLYKEVHFFITDKMDLMAAAYCLKHCFSLRKLCFSIQNVFEEEHTHTSTSDYHLTSWHHICSVLTTNKNLRELQVSDSNLEGSAFATLSDHLWNPSCRLQKLQIRNVSFSGESWFFFKVFTNSPDLEHLDLSGMRLSHSDVVLLCNALNNPTCNIEKLLLANCGLSADDCEGFSEVLKKNAKLKLLNLSYNYLHRGLSLLCEALCHPACALQVLVLVCCYPRECCWGNLCDALLCNKNLIHLDLSTNVLKSKDLKLLCEALKQPFCCLKSLCLLNCFITSDGCRDLASVLTGNPNLRNLQIGRNDVEDDGVRLLCRALLHPNCHLEQLGLGACKLTSACCEDLASVLTSNRTLKTLNLMGNALDRNGVLVLCAALRHPECRLRTLGLKIAEFDEETQRLLVAEKERNPDLTIRDE
ncbi:NACHT, LRR and PYD domains-containing protein 4-like [Molossus molossus]|uniref:NLR family pyrin domain containing 4 n=1 Tax=Molossus molossus TaxID=27622 RepID=A0A7J8C9S1_MOLMO|nr:NACHT, LRR and PYD domains-containing protein 4-like [Molossus molossus]KAF6407582.1 NLR family pyrin domain containing 4 [Molossus molossus]